MKHLRFAVLIAAFSAALFCAGPAGAQSLINPNTPAYAEGDYGLNDFILLAVQASDIVLGLVGSLSLAMFIYGGFMFLISRGSSEAISKARKILGASVVGLVIVFSSYLIIRFIMVDALGINLSGVTWGSRSIEINTSQLGN